MKAITGRAIWVAVFAAAWLREIEDPDRAGHSADKPWRLASLAVEAYRDQCAIVAAESRRAADVGATLDALGIERRA